MDRRDHDRAEGADAGRLNGRGNAREDHAEHQCDQGDGGQHVQQQTDFLARIDALRNGQGGAKRGVQPAARAHIGDVHGRQDQARHNGADK